MEPHGHRRWTVDAMLGRFADSSYAYRFGPPPHAAVRARLAGEGDKSGGDLARPAIQWRMTYRLAFTEDPAELLSTASELLAAEPVVSTVMSTFTERAGAREGRGEARAGAPLLVGERPRGRPGRGGGDAHRAVRPHPMFVLPMPDEAARAIADASPRAGRRSSG